MEHEHKKECVYVREGDHAGRSGAVRSSRAQKKREEVRFGQKKRLLRADFAVRHDLRVHGVPRLLKMTLGTLDQLNTLLLGK